MRFHFGNPGTPAEPLLACPACFHVGAGRVRDADRLECEHCHRVVVRFTGEDEKDE